MVNTAVICTFAEIHGKRKMFQHFRLKDPLIHEQGFHGVFQAPVTLLSVAPAKDL